MSSPLKTRLRLQVVIVGLITIFTTFLITVLSEQKVVKQQRQLFTKQKEERQLKQQRQQQQEGDAFVSYMDDLDLLELFNSNSSPPACRDLNFVSRKEWSAKESIPSKNIIQKFQQIPEKVFIHQAWDGRTCNDIDSCKIRLLAMQAYHQYNKGWPDISYNFLISGDGSIFEGLGFQNIGFHTLNYNHNSYGIAFIGTFHNILPTKRMEFALESLIECSVQIGYLSTAYTLHGHRDARCTICPGDAAYSRISTMDRFKAGPLSNYSCPVVEAATSSLVPRAVAELAAAEKASTRGSINSKLLTQKQKQKQQQKAGEAQFRDDGQLNKVDEPQIWQSIQQKQPIQRTNLSYEDTQSLLDYLFHHQQQQQQQQNAESTEEATTTTTGDAPAKLVKHKQTPEEPRGVISDAENKLNQLLVSSFSNSASFNRNKIWNNIKNRNKNKNNQNKSEQQLQIENENQNQFQNALIMRDREPQKVVNINSNNKLISLALHANSHSNANWNLNSLQSPNTKLDFQSNSVVGVNEQPAALTLEQQQQQQQQHDERSKSKPALEWSSGGENVAKKEQQQQVPLLEETFVSLMRRRQGGGHFDVGSTPSSGSKSSDNDDFTFRTLSDSSGNSLTDGNNKPAAMFKSEINKPNSKFIVINMPTTGQQPSLPVGGATIAPSFYLLTSGVKPGTIGIITGGGGGGGGTTAGGAGAGGGTMARPAAGSTARPAAGGGGLGGAGGSVAGGAGGGARPAAGGGATGGFGGATGGAGGAGAGAGAARPGGAVGAGGGAAGGVGAGAGATRPGGAGGGALGGAGGGQAGGGGGASGAAGSRPTGFGGATTTGGAAGAGAARPAGSGTAGVFSATSEQESGASPPRSTIGSFLDRVLSMTYLGNISIF